MAKLQAASVSNQVVNRKRKRKHNHEAFVDDVNGNGEVAEAPASETMTKVPTKTHDGGAQPRRSKAKEQATYPTSQLIHEPCRVRYSLAGALHVSGAPPPSTEPCLHFLLYSQTLCNDMEQHQVCRRGSHQATSTLEEDVAQVKALVPRAIHFAYVDEDYLQVTLAGEGNDISAGRADWFQSKEDGKAKQQKKEQAEELLLFEFVDGDLKRQVRDPKTGEPVKATQKLRNEELKMPVFSQKSMLKLIEKRNVKFTSAVNAFLNKCAADGTDPVKEIKDFARSVHPTPNFKSAHQPETWQQTTEDHSKGA